MNRSVVVGVNGSPESLAATEWAAEEAQRRELPLWLLHASEAGWDDTPKSTRLPELSEPLRRSLLMLQEAERHISARYPTVTVQADQITQDPRDALQAAAEEAELLVLGSSGLGAVTGFLIGSVALAIANHASCPVVLVRADTGAPAGDVSAAASSTRGTEAEVVLGLDLHHPCDPLLAFAFDAAARRSARLRVVHCWRPPVPYAYAPGFTVPGTELDTEPELESQVMRELTAALQPWRARWPTVEVIGNAVQGRPGHHLTHAAAHAQLLVIGRRARHPAIGTRLGPVAHAVIHHARCPVAVVPHE
ncbi:universal stress protein [Streptomyces iconiensis]|uniref:Universal stress protein n=1 Tax=Streptomyces iconiensis TaxID=1384038 RepID=A0ABT7A2C2_9ACTN|nr:universal stress protein [Streptomyces iconiensis]MDJ1135485.1 universal stress protein [Streptomyces iconiensis]